MLRPNFSQYSFNQNAMQISAVILQVTLIVLFVLPHHSFWMYMVAGIMGLLSLFLMEAGTTINVLDKVQESEKQEHGLWD